MTDTAANSRTINAGGASARCPSSTPPRRSCAFLEGTPTVSRLNQIHVGADIPTQLQSDLAAEVHTNSMYNEAIHLSDEANDAATRDLLESIVKEEDGHVDWLESQLDQVSQLGVPLYLSTQTRA